MSDRKGRWRYTYNRAGRLENVYNKHRLIARYQYNSQGLRTQKILYKRQKAITFSYFYDLGGQLIAEYKNQKPLRDMIWVDNQPQVQIEVKQQRNGTLVTRHITYLTIDHLNTRGGARMNNKL